MVQCLSPLGGPQDWSMCAGRWLADLFVCASHTVEKQQEGGRIHQVIVLGCVCATLHLWEKVFVWAPLQIQERGGG